MAALRPAVRVALVLRSAGGTFEVFVRGARELSGPRARQQERFVA
jgi:hypothetical protein